MLDKALGDLAAVRSHGSVAAVVVTRNRLHLLQRCIASLREQTYPVNQIIVVDNGSTDGTHEWLEGQSLTVIVQGNLGSAGGQNTGLAEAMKTACDWFWLMDDDGFAAPDALEKIFAGRSDVMAAQWLNCLVLEDKDTSRLVFGIAGIMTVSQAARFGTVISGANPFNGTLLGRRLVENIGLPASDLFIWGDEAEYASRALRAGFLVVTITASRFFHPRANDPFNVVGDDLKGFWKRYYWVRNQSAYYEKGCGIRFNAKAAFSLAIRLSFLLLRHVAKSPGCTIEKLWIIWRGVLSAVRQDRRIVYP